MASMFMPISGESVTAETILHRYQILRNDKDELQIGLYFIGCTPGAKSAIYDWMVSSEPRVL